MSETHHQDRDDVIVGIYTAIALGLIVVVSGLGFLAKVINAQAMPNMPAPVEHSAPAHH